MVCEIINKCRLCGRKSELNTGCKDLNEIEGLINSAIRDGRNQPFKGFRSGFIVQLVGTHRCKNGNLGLTDLIGIKFSEEAE